MLSKILIAGPHLSGLGLLGHSVTVGNVNSSKGYAIESTIIIVGFISHTKDEFIIQPCDSHKKIAPNNYKNVPVYKKYRNHTKNCPSYLRKYSSLLEIQQFGCIFLVNFHNFVIIWGNFFV